MEELGKIRYSFVDKIAKIWYRYPKELILWQY